MVAARLEAVGEGVNASAATASAREVPLPRDVLVLLKPRINPLVTLVAEAGTVPAAEDFELGRTSSAA